MNRDFGLGLLMGFFFFHPCSMSAQSAAVERRPHFTVAVCDQAAVSPEMLSVARRQTVEIFSRAELDVIWVDLDSRARCPIPRGALRWFVVVILPKAEDAASPEAMGHAPGRTGLFPRAYVFYNWVGILVDLIDRQHRIAEGHGIILGHAVAHELGHLLIPERSHSLTGVMSTEWNYRHWEDAVSGRLLFNEAEAKAIRARLQRR